MSVSIGITCPGALSLEVDYAGLLQAWTAVAPELLPTHMGDRDPPAWVFRADRPEDTEGFWRAGRWIGRRRGPRPVVSTMFAVPGRGSTLSISSVAPSAPAQVSAGRLFDRLLDHVTIDLGFVHVMTPQEMKEAENDEERIDVARDDRMTHLLIVDPAYPQDLRDGLPPLYWRTAFGQPYRNLIGDEHLRRAPVAAVEEIGSALVLTLTSGPPTSDTWQHFVSVREAAMDHLGRNLFRPGATRVPELALHPASPPGATREALDGLPGEIVHGLDTGSAVALTQVVEAVIEARARDLPIPFGLQLGEVVVPHIVDGLTSDAAVAALRAAAADAIDDPATSAFAIIGPGRSPEQVLVSVAFRHGGRRALIISGRDYVEVAPSVDTWNPFPAWTDR